MRVYIYIYIFNSAENKCEVCKDPVGSAHKCIKCKKYVHIFRCGTPVNGTEEGYGQPVTCTTCSK